MTLRRGRWLLRHGEQLRQLGRERRIAGDLELAAEEQRHGGLHAAVDHRAEVVVGRLDRALGLAGLAGDGRGRRRQEVDGPGAAVGPRDLEQVDGRDVLGLLGIGRQRGGNLLVEERLHGRGHRGPPSFIVSTLLAALALVVLVLGILAIALGDGRRVAGLVDHGDAPDGERAVGNVLGDGGPRGDDGVAPDAHGRDELAVRADEGAVLDDRLTLLVAIVIARDRAGADVDTRADDGVPQIAEVVGLAAPPQHRLLELDEVADVRLGPDVGAGPEARERSDDGAGPNDGVVRDRVRQDARPRAHLGVDEDAAVLDVRAVAYARAAAQRDVAADLGVDVDRDVGLDDGRRGLSEGRVLLPAAVDARAHGRLGVGELLAVIDARDVARVGLYSGDADRARGDGDDVGQVVLALRVLGDEPGRRLSQEVRGRGVDAGVDLGERALVGRRVLLLDDTYDVAARVTHDAPVARGVGRRRRDERETFVATRGPHERLQRLPPQQRHVAVQHEHDPTKALERRHREAHGVARAALLGLLDDGDRVGAEARREHTLDERQLMPEHGDDGRRPQLAREAHGVRDERAPEQLVQHLRARRAHARALARREDDRGDGTLVRVLARLLASVLAFSLGGLCLSLLLRLLRGGHVVTRT